MLWTWYLIRWLNNFIKSWLVVSFYQTMIVTYIRIILFIIIWNIHQFIVNCLIPSGPWFFWWLCLETFGYSTFICFTHLGWIWNDLMLQCLDKTNMLMWLFEIILLWKLHLSHTYTYTHAPVLSHTHTHRYTCLLLTRDLKW